MNISSIFRGVTKNLDKTAEKSVVKTLDESTKKFSEIGKLKPQLNDDVVFIHKSEQNFQKVEPETSKSNFLNIFKKIKQSIFKNNNEVNDAKEKLNKLQIKDSDSPQIKAQKENFKNVMSEDLNSKKSGLSPEQMEKKQYQDNRAVSKTDERFKAQKNKKAQAAHDEKQAYYDDFGKELDKQDKLNAQKENFKNVMGDTGKKSDLSPEKRTKLQNKDNKNLDKIDKKFKKQENKKFQAAHDEKQAYYDSLGKELDKQDKLNAQKENFKNVMDEDLNSKKSKLSPEKRMQAQNKDNKNITRQNYKFQSKNAEEVKKAHEEKQAYYDSLGKELDLKENFKNVMDKDLNSKKSNLSPEKRATKQYQDNRNISRQDKKFKTEENKKFKKAHDEKQAYYDSLGKELDLKENFKKVMDEDLNSKKSNLSPEKRTKLQNKDNKRISKEDKKFKKQENENLQQTHDEKRAYYSSLGKDLDELDRLNKLEAQKENFKKVMDEDLNSKKCVISDENRTKLQNKNNEIISEEDKDFKAKENEKFQKAHDEKQAYYDSFGKDLDKIEESKKAEDAAKAENKKLHKKLIIGGLAATGATAAGVAYVSSNKEIEKPEENKESEKNQAKEE